MKFSSYSVLAVLMITSLLSCGKSNSSGSGSGTNSSQNPISNPILTTSGTTAHNELKSWFQSTNESTSKVVTKGEFLTETAPIQQGFSLSGSFSLCIGGLVSIGNCDQAQVLPNKCYEKKSDGKFYVGTPFISNNIVMGCPGSQVYSKASNLDLKAAIYGVEGLELKDVYKSSASTYVLTYFRPGYYSPSKIITIDTSLASFVNPVYTRDIESSEVTALKGITVRVR